MNPLEAVGSFIKEASVKLHLRVLSGNDNSNSPRDRHDVKSVDKSKILTKSKNKGSISTSDSQTSTVDNSTHIDHSVHNNYYVLGIPENINPENLPEELKPLADEFANKRLSFVAQADQQRVESVFAFEDDPHIRGQLRFFKPILDSRDYQLLRTGLFLGHLRTSNPEAARIEWKSIRENATGRDRKIINLAGAGYFNTYFRPFARALGAGSVATREQFRSYFKTIIDDMHFVIFVGSDMSVGDVMTELVNKTRKNIRYGVKDEVIYIHAAGRSVRTVESALDEIRRVFKHVVVKHENKTSHVLVKVSVFYRENDLI